MIPPLKGKPVNVATARHVFEISIAVITGCTPGDGTLEVNEDRTYTNPHIQYLWTRYLNRPMKQGK